MTTRPSTSKSIDAAVSARAMLDHPEGQAKSLTVEDLVHRCEEIAAASGGILGFGKISGQERALLGRIQTALKGR